ncbi:hypothetical protein D8S78_15120 [Natrialba swarupiae]|nr:hypothetical protein [Natrialba swarupiae]
MYRFTPGNDSERAGGISRRQFAAGAAGTTAGTALLPGVSTSSRSSRTTAGRRRCVPGAPGVRRRLLDRFGPVEGPDLPATGVADPDHAGTYLTPILLETDRYNAILGLGIRHPNGTTRSRSHAGERDDLPNSSE